MSTATETDHDVVTIAPGIELCVEKHFYLHNEEVVNDVVRQCKVVMLDRPAALARIRECVDLIATIGDDDERFTVHPLDLMCEVIGWTSNFTTHTHEDYRKALNALVEIIGDADLVDALESAEHYVKMMGGAQ